MTNDLGFGIGLRTAHYREISDALSRSDRNDTALAGVDWFEIISENFFEPGGNPRRMLRTMREHYPLAMHGVSLSIGSTDPLHEAYLQSLSELVAELEPAIISDHLCWSNVGGRFAHDLLPLPFTEEALEHVAERIARVQDRLGRRILIENISSYAEFHGSTLSEWDFLAELGRVADCGILLDVNNVFVSAHNHGFDARQYIGALPRGRVGQIHLAGHTARGQLLIDTHDGTVREEVWDLYQFATERHGSVATLIEWDDKIPPLDGVAAEARRARAVQCDALQAPTARRPEVSAHG